MHNSVHYITSLLETFLRVKCFQFHNYYTILYNRYKYYKVDGKKLSKIVQTLPLDSKHYVMYDSVLGSFSICKERVGGLINLKMTVVSHGFPYQQVDVEQNILMEINLDISEIKVKVTVLP